MRGSFLVCAAACAAPLVLLAFTTGSPIKSTGAPSDGGTTCAACHTPPAGPALGSVSIDASTYSPGVQQTIHVSVTDPAATRWGFQLTARVINGGEVKEAGTFSSSDPNVKIVCDDGTANGSAGPCTNTREFAEHKAAPNTAVGAGFTFNVDWMPPASETGDIVFYYSAVAANGDGGVTGDRTYTGAKAISAVGACNNAKRPIVNRVINAGSFSTAALSPGGLWAVTGSNFQIPGLTRSAGLGDFVNGSYPTKLACVAVTVNDQPAPITYVQEDQINLQAPFNLPAGPVSVKVFVNAGQQNELMGDVATANVQTLSPAFFTFNGTSIAARFATTGAIVANPAVVPGGRLAKSGDIVSLFGTGFGPTNPSVAAGALATGITPVTTTPVSVTIGTVTLNPSDILYVGLSPGSISGLYQINVRIPPGIRSGDTPVVVTIGGAQTQAGATIPTDAVVFAL